MKFKHIQSVIIIGLLCCLRSFCSGQSKQVKTFALESYSFNKLLNDKIKGRAEGISLMDFLKIAADNQFDAVSITGYFFLPILKYQLTKKLIKLNMKRES